MCVNERACVTDVEVVGVESIIGGVFCTDVRNGSSLGDIVLRSKTS